MWPLRDMKFRGFDTLEIRRLMSLVFVTSVAAPLIFMLWYANSAIMDAFAESDKVLVKQIGSSLAKRLAVELFLHRTDIEGELETLRTANNLTQLSIHFPDGKVITSGSIEPSIIPKVTTRIEETLLTPLAQQSKKELGVMKLVYVNESIGKMWYKQLMWISIIILFAILYERLEKRLIVRVLRPLNSIANAMRAYRPGTHLSLHVDPSRHSEQIVDIAKGFMQMQQNIDDTMRQHQEEIERSKEKDEMLVKQARFTEMGVMISNIAHQWKQPLNIVESVMTDLRFKSYAGKLDDEYFETAYQRLHRQIEYMAETIDIFKNFLNNGTSERTQYRPADALDNALRLLGNTFRKDGIELMITSDSELTVKGSQQELEQVFLVLLNNSIDAIKSNAASGFIVVTIKRNNTMCVIEVEDNGGGFPEEYAERIFTPYFTTKHMSQGTGIGLWIAKTIVELKHQGSIIAENVEGGARFTITIPLEENAEESL